MQSIKHQVGTIEIEVFQTETGAIGLIIRDLSIPLPEFDATKPLECGTYNVIHQDWL
jgi:hypothetical protein